MAHGPTEGPQPILRQKTCSNGAKMTVGSPRDQYCEDNISQLVTNLVLQLFTCGEVPLSL